MSVHMFVAVEDVISDNTLKLICLTDDHVATSTEAITSAAPSTSSSSAAVSAPSSVGFSGKKGTGRTRPRPISSSTVATAEAAAKISHMAESQKAYYTAKLDMERKEHEIRMRILLLQEEFEIERLRKLEE